MATPQEHGLIAARLLHFVKCILKRISTVVQLFIRFNLTVAAYSLPSSIFEWWLLCAAIQHLI